MPLVVSRRVFAGLERKIPRVVTAGSMHCACLTGEIHKGFYLSLEVVIAPVQHIPHNPLFLSSPEDGDLFLWGSNKHGQLISRDPFLPSATPVKRSLLGGEKVHHVWSGWTHIIAQTGEAGKHTTCLIATLVYRIRKTLGQVHQAKK